MGLPANEARIDEAEHQIGLRLPDALRQRLLRNNGGEIEVDGEPWILHSVWDPTNRKTAARSATHIVAETSVGRQWTGFPADAVAIAEDGYGNRLILRPAKDEPEVWLHETAEVVAAEVNWEV